MNLAIRLAIILIPVLLIGCSDGASGDCGEDNKNCSWARTTFVGSSRDVGILYNGRQRQLHYWTNKVERHDPFRQEDKVTINYFLQDPVLLSINPDAYIIVEVNLDGLVISVDENLSFYSAMHPDSWLRILLFNIEYQEARDKGNEKVKNELSELRKVREFQKIINQLPRASLN